MTTQILLGLSGREICTVYRWSSRRAPSVLICGGAGNSMSEPRCFLSLLAEACCRAGLNAYQFDYLGDGDSAGDYRSLSVASALASAETVLGFAESLGTGPFALIGYGIGNLVAALLAARQNVTALALIAPHLWLFREGSVARTGLCAEEPDGLWRALVGEDLQPTQPRGPLGDALLDQARAARPETALKLAAKPLFVASDRDDDAILSPGGATGFHSIRHTPTLYRPSWHWCAECRERISAAILEWLAGRPGMQPQEPASCFPRPPPPAPAACRPGARDSIHSLTSELGGERILGVLHLPSSRRRARDLGVIFEPGIPGQRVDIHRSGPRMGAALAARGFCVFRYDSRGMGVSEGEFHNVTWTGRLAETRHAMDLLHALYPARCRRFVIVGSSAGARAAYLAANRDERVAACVTWGPVLVEPPSRVGEGVVRRHPSGALVTELCGLWLGVGYNLDERRYDFLDELRRCRRPGLVAFATGESDSLNARAVTRIVAGQPEKTLVELPGPHGFSARGFDLLLRLTVQWLAAFADRRGSEGLP